MNWILASKLKALVKIALGTAAILLFLNLLGCSSERETVSAAPETVSNVSVVSAQAVVVPDVVEAVGTLRAAETSQLDAQMMGNIVEIRVREGDRVRRGQVLAVIDEAQPRAALDRATAGEARSCAPPRDQHAVQNARGRALRSCIGASQSAWPPRKTMRPV